MTKKQSMKRRECARQRDAQEKRRGIEDGIKMMWREGRGTGPGVTGNFERRAPKRIVRSCHLKGSPVLSTGGNALGSSQARCRRHVPGQACHITLLGRLKVPVVACGGLRWPASQSQVACTIVAGPPRRRPNVDDRSPPTIVRRGRTTRFSNIRPNAWSTLC
jgi:hypothetical protein